MRMNVKFLTTKGQPCNNINSKRNLQIIHLYTKIKIKKRYKPKELRKLTTNW